MFRAFHFCRNENGHVIINCSPLDNVVRLRISIDAEVVSIEQAHILEHCIVEAHRRRVLLDHGTIGGVTTSTHVTITIHVPYTRDINEYMNFTDIVIDRPLLDRVMPMIHMEYRQRQRRLGFVKDSCKVAQMSRQELLETLRTWRMTGALVPILYRSEGSANLDISNMDASIEYLRRFSNNSAANHIIERVSSTVPDTVQRRWDDLSFRRLAVSRYRLLLNSPSFFIREVDQLIDLGYSSKSVNAAIMELIGRDD